MNFDLKYIDMGVLILITLGFFLAYLIYSIIYFVKFDKNIKKDSTGTNHGLSRMCLIGTFFLFGFLTFDLAMQFGQVYLSEYIKFKEYPVFTSVLMEKCFTFFNFITKYQLLPLEVFINGMFAISFFYIGVEGLIASLKTLNIEAGLRIELPAKKRTRLATLFYIWCFFSVLTTVYTILLGNINFYNKNCVFCTIGTLIIVILSERSPSALENVTIVKSKDSEKVNCNIVDGQGKKDITVKECVQTINDIATGIVNGVASDKNDISQLENIVVSENDNGK